MGNIAFPTIIDLALTGRCNLRCKHCNTSSTWDLDNELSFDQIINVLDELKENKIFELNLFGGEPFCYPRIIDLLEELNNYPMRITILTNGALIDKKIVDTLKNMKFLANIQVSIDGSAAEIHDWQRGKGSFSGAINAVKVLKKEALPVTIKAIINTSNYNDIENMVKMAIELGLDGMSFGDAVECGRAALFASDMQFEGEIYQNIMRRMFRLQDKYPDFDFGGTLYQKVQMLEDFYRNGPGKGTRGTFSTCPAGQNTLSIRSDGKVVPCSAFWTLICGDIKENSLKDIWENSRVFNRIRDLADKPLTDHNEDCKKCDYLSYCNGGCRAAAYYASKCNIEGIDPVNCLTFSDIYNFRVDEGSVLNKENA